MRAHGWRGGWSCGDFEDALQAVSAEACGADWLVTRNVADFSQSRVPALTPKDFLANVEVL